MRPRRNGGGGTVAGNRMAGDFAPRVADHTLRLTGSDLHVWAIPLDVPEGEIIRSARVLSEDERARAGRFHFDIHRRRYTAGRAALRAILAAYSGKRAEDMRFIYGPYGKPYLAPPDDGVRFNLSNSEGHAVCVVARDTEVGIDLEVVRELSDYETLARQFFSPGETEALLALPQSLRGEAFVSYWTHKEAFLKALGSGLALDSFEVTLKPGEAPRLLSVKGSPERAAGWSLISLLPVPGFVAAVAVRGRPRAVRTWRHQTQSGGD
jgi:4'-phosphopantetheinyl transferase